MKTLPRAAICIAALTTMALAQSTTRVVPTAQTSTEGNLGSTQPFVWSIDGARHQQILSAGALGKALVTISEIRYRRDNGWKFNWLALTTPQMKFKLGTAKTTPDTMDMSFAANRKGALTTLFTGSVSLPALNIGNKTFAVRIPLTRPFTHVVSSGDILLESEIATGNRGPSTYWVVDAHGPAITGSSWLPYGAPGKFKSREASLALHYPFSPLAPGGRLSLYRQELNSDYPTLAAYGFSNKSLGSLQLPFSLAPLGAPGNNIYTSMDIVFPATSRRNANSTFIFQADLEIPKIQKLRGTKVYGQFLHIDTASNQLGIVASNGVDFTIGDAQDSRQSQSIFASSLTASSGEYSVISPTHVGVAPVVQLVGSFR